MPTDHSKDFYAADGVIYLNCANQGPMPKVAIQAVEKSLDFKKTPHLITDEMHFGLPNDYRQAVGRLIGAPPETIAVTDSATQGIMLMVGGLDWRPGDEVLIGHNTFPSNRFPWRSLERQGVVVREIASHPGAEGTDAWREAISDRTRVVAIGWINYSTGRRRDLAALGELCREHDALLVVDATQGVGGVELNLRETPCDLLACAGYKWMLGPYGVGFAYVSPPLIERLTLHNINWLSIVGAEDFAKLGNCELQLVPTAQRFDRNEPATFFNLSGAVASAHYLLDIGPKAIEDHVRGLLDHLIDHLPADYRAVSSLESGERSNILCIAAGSAEATQASYQRLRDAGVWVSLRENAIRISPNIYNTLDEIDTVLSLLR